VHPTRQSLHGIFVKIQIDAAVLVRGAHEREEPCLLAKKMLAAGVLWYRSIQNA
jgi:hypothetical protein